jgi:predicted exporter
MALLDEWQGKLSSHSRPVQRHGVWFSRDLERSLVLVEISPGELLLETQEDAVSVVRERFERISQPGLEMILTGPAAFAVETGEDIRRDVRLLTWLAITFVTLFLLLVYRSLVMVLLVFMPLLMGVVAATACILLLHGQIHGITLAFGITLAGVAVDYPIHLMTGLSRRQGGDPGYAARIWPTLRLGVLSTVIAYAAFLMSGFGGLVQLGQFTITGLVVAALFSRWVLPVFFVGGGRGRQGLMALHRFLVQLTNRAVRLRWFVVVALVTGILALAVTERPILHLNVDSLSPIKDSRRAEGKMLRNDLGYWHGGRMLIVTATDKDAVLERSEAIESALEALRQSGRISGFDMASQFLPSLSRQRRNLDALQDPPAIRDRLHAATEDSPFKPGTFDPFEAEIDSLAGADPITVDALMAEDIGRRLEPLIFDIAGESAGVVLLHGVVDEAVMTEFADAREGVIYMHLKTAATALVTRSVERVRLIMLGCALVIYLILWFAYRSPVRPLRIMVPTIAAAAVTSALLVFSGNPLSVFHLISLMLVVGLGLDYALFFNRLSDEDSEWNTTFRSLWVCGTTTILVFGILVVSHTPPLRAIGMTVGIGAALSILFAAAWATTRAKHITPAIQQ